MAIVEVVKYDGPPDVFAWKHPNPELGTWTQLIVNESQEAILFKGGQALDIFGAGRHTLSTQNIPILQSLVNLPFGGKSPFAAEVWFVNKLNSLDIKWGTAAPIQLQDPKYQIIVSVRSFGQFGLQIEDTRKFLLKLIGTLRVFDKEAMTQYFRGLLMMNIKELISSYLVHKKISILEINAYISEISKHIEERIAPVFQESGIRLLNFYIDSVNTPDNDPGTIRLKEALAKKAEMDIIGYSYQQERSFDTLEGAATNEGSGSGLMNAGLGMGMGLGMGGAFGNQMMDVTRQMNTSSSTSSTFYKGCPKCQTMNAHDARFCSSCAYNFLEYSAPNRASAFTCSNCSKPLPDGSKFCPHCGDPYTPCPNCGADHAVDAQSCAQCGHSLLAGQSCNNCGEKVADGVKFCPHCGTSTSLRCGQCQHEVKPGQKFCLECGNKLVE